MGQMPHLRFLTRARDSKGGHRAGEACCPPPRRDTPPSSTASSGWFVSRANRRRRRSALHGAPRRSYGAPEPLAEAKTGASGPKAPFPLGATISCCGRPTATVPTREGFERTRTGVEVAVVSLAECHFPRFTPRPRGLRPARGGSLARAARLGWVGAQGCAGRPARRRRTVP
jgi:hypothetical protein